MVKGDRWSWELTSESFAGGDPSGALCFTGHGPHLPEPRSCDGIYRSELETFEEGYGS